MNINELYQSIATFWDKISPLLYFHIVALLVLAWIYGNNWYILERLEYFLSSEKYARWKKILDEFSLRPVIPYTLLIIFFLYLSLLNNVLGLFDGFGPLSIVYSETEFWRESRPLTQLVEIASYQSKTDLKVWEIYYIEQKFLEEYKSQYPEKYNSLVGWISKDYGAWLQYYQLSLLFLITLGFIFYNQIKNRHQRAKRLLKIAEIILLTLAVSIFFRIQAEQSIEKKVNSELSFVINQLRIDPKQKSSKMNNDNMSKLECNLYSDLKNSDTYTFDNLWVSRYFEFEPLFVRQMPSVTDLEFKNQNDVLEKQCQQSP